jgi:hypothetical protein
MCELNKMQNLINTSQINNMCLQQCNECDDYRRHVQRTLCSQQQATRCVECLSHNVHVLNKRVNTNTENKHNGGWTRDPVTGGYNPPPLNDQPVSEFAARLGLSRAPLTRNHYTAQADSPVMRQQFLNPSMQSHYRVSPFGNPQQGPIVVDPRGVAVRIHMDRLPQQMHPYGNSGYMPMYIG